MFSYLFLSVFLLAIGAQGAPSLSGRIVGGQTAKKGQFPYQVAIQHNNGTFQCNGIIIDKYWVLSSAHCVNQLQLGDILMAVGDNRQNDAHIKYRAEKLIAHDEYNESTRENDIGVIRVHVGFMWWDETIQPIKLSRKEIREGEKVVYPQPEFGNDLQYINLETISINQCRISYKNDTENALPIFDTEICAIAKKGEGICFGDSGSPLVLEDTKELVGVASWEIPCAKGVPDVFTRVSSYIDWIQEHTQ